MPLRRILRPTLAIVTETHLGCTIPVDAIIEVPSSGESDSNRLIDVLWNGVPHVMFVRDLQSRSEAIE